MVDQPSTETVRSLAGTSTTYLHFGVVAEFDVMTGALVRVVTSLPHLSERATPLVVAIEADDATQDAVRRLALLDLCQGEEPWRDELFELDRVAALLTIEKGVPGVPKLGLDDELIEAAVDGFANGAFGETEFNREALQSVRQLLHDKTSHDVEQPYFDDSTRSRGHFGVGSEPDEALDAPLSVEALSASVLLAGWGESTSTWHEGNLEVTISIDEVASSPEYWADRVVGYLIDDAADQQPIVGISFPRVGMGALTFGFKLASPPTRSMVVAVSPYGSPDVTMNKEVRGRLDCEVAIFAAVRFSQKGLRQRARDLLELARDRALDNACRSQIVEALAAIDDVPPSGLIADL